MLCCAMPRGTTIHFSCRYLDTYTRAVLQCQCTPVLHVLWFTSMYVYVCIVCLCVVVLVIAIIIAAERIAYPVGNSIKFIKYLCSVDEQQALWLAVGVCVCVCVCAKRLSLRKEFYVINRQLEFLNERKISIFWRNSFSNSHEKFWNRAILFQWFGSGCVCIWSWTTSVLKNSRNWIKKIQK